MKSRLYPIIAWFFDLYVFSFFLGAIAALISVVSPQTNELFLGLFGLGSSLLLSLIYHIFIARRVSWLSPGELGVGRIFQEEQKEWSNPYGVNRWALFLMIFTALAIAGNSWDRLGDEFLPAYTLWEIVAKLIGLLFVTYALTQVGKGNVMAGLIFVAYAMLTGLLAPLAMEVVDVSIPMEAVRLMTMVFVGISVFQLVVVFTYANLKKKQKGKVAVDNVASEVEILSEE